MVAVSSSLKTIFKKTERGIVLIHQYKNNGYNIVLDVYSGAVHVVDELCYDVIACLNEENEAHTPETLQEEKTFEGLKNALQDTYSEEELKDALDDVTELAKNGQLFVKDEYECLIEDVKKRKTVVCQQNKNYLCQAQNKVSDAYRLTNLSSPGASSP